MKNLKKKTVPEIQRMVHRFDARDKALGRLASSVAFILIGKHKPQFTYNQDWGDQVIVYNIEKIKLTGRKREKFVYRHTGYPGGLKTKKLGNLLENNPNILFLNAVKNMLPKNKLRKFWLKRLKIFKNNLKQKDE